MGQLAYGYYERSRQNNVNYGNGQTQNYTFDATSNRTIKTHV